MNIQFARAGAVTYVLWGVLHIEAAKKVYQLGGTLEPGMLQGRIFQDAAFLLFFGVFAIVVAGWLNWKNSRLGFWLNLTIVSACDLAFIAFVLLPGYVPLVPGSLGPLLWILAGVLSAVAMFADRDGDQHVGHRAAHQKRDHA